MSVHIPGYRTIKTTGQVYKVWIEIEEYDIEEETGHTLGPLNIPCSGTFATLEEAEQLAERLAAQVEVCKEGLEEVDHP